MAARATTSGSASTSRRSPPAALRRQPRVVQRGVEAGEVGRLDEGAGLREQLGTRALRLDPPAADDHHAVGDRLDLGQQVRREQHGAAAVGEAAQQLAHPAHALRVEPVGGLVEDQDLGLAEQRVGEPEALAHAERVGADAPAARRLVEADEVEQRVDARAGTPIVCAETASASRPRRPACCAEASSRIPTRRPGFGRSR
jgi:hypothetical protein